MNVIQERDTTTIRQTVTFNASPHDVYEMIMDSKKHESLSGEKASISREVGGAFRAWVIAPGWRKRRARFRSAAGRATATTERSRQS